MPLSKKPAQYKVNVSDMPDDWLSCQEPRLLESHATVLTSLKIPGACAVAAETVFGD
jgi:hypothetical protein